jgi:hypothetical protein
MSTPKPFALRIFVADGDPDGLRVVERSNWIGKALVFPRAVLSVVKSRSELGQTGVDLLLGPREDGEGEMLYVGEGDPVRPRLESHFQFAVDGGRCHPWTERERAARVEERTGADAEGIAGDGDGRVNGNRVSCIPEWV